ncbi:hypothetical protein [Citrobacter freundii]|uniref:hypothetical protein n=1 Tax=Citrobacter freundii TaxID=546 RepID=UPI001E501D84|nr:hypothetical protein [Citrobacter freundii]
MKAIILDEAVCKLLKIVESLDQFHVLGTELSTEDGWGWKMVPQIKNLRVALPSQYFDLEEELRTSLGLYFLAIESVDKYKNRVQWPADLTIHNIVKKITAYKFEGKKHVMAEKFFSFISELNETEESTTFITICRQYLNFDEILNEFIAVLQALIIQANLSPSPHNEIKKTDVLTSSGMLIREVNEVE